MKTQALLAFFLLFTACGQKNTSFQTKAYKKPAKVISVDDGKKGNTGDTGVLAITCNDETENEDIKLQFSNKEKAKIGLDISCPAGRENAIKIETKKPADIIFVLDITASMEVNINNIIKNISNFAEKMEEKQWDARFAAIGYKDINDDMIILPFQNAASLKEKISLWKAEGGKEVQEAGQDALLKAFEIFAPSNSSSSEEAITSLLKSSSQRENSDKIILLVTDAPSYTPYQKEEHTDFTTTTLEEKIQEKLKNLLNVKFYHSSSNKAEKGTKPTEQWESFRTKTHIQGKALGYPLTDEEFLNEFAAVFEEIPPEDTMCIVKDASVYIGNQEVAKIERKPEDYRKIETPIEIEISTPKNKENVEIKINRCCIIKNEDSSLCHTEEEIKKVFIQ